MRGIETLGFVRRYAIHALGIYPHSTRYWKKVPTSPNRDFQKGRESLQRRNDLEYSTRYDRELRLPTALTEAHSHDECSTVDLHN